MLVTLSNKPSYYGSKGLYNSTTPFERRIHMINKMERCELFADMARYVGKTVTIFTASGGLSGAVVII